jgi:hypothetical protein
MYSYIPFSLLALLNLLLIIHINKKKSNLEQNKTQVSKQKTMNRTVISMTLMYIIMTIPGTLVSIYYGFLIQTDWGTFLLFLGDSIDNSYHGLNFIILLITNKKFLNEAKNILTKKKVIREFVSSLQSNVMI